MSFSFKNLSLANIQASSASAVLQPGRYVVKVNSVKIEDTKAGTGKILRVMFTCKEGVIRDNINVYNPSEAATKIGLEQLKSLLVNANHPDPDNIGAYGVDSIVGLTTGLVVGSEMYNNEKRSKVKGYCKPEMINPTQATAAPVGPTLGTEANPF